MLTKTLRGLFIVSVPESGSVLFLVNSWLHNRENHSILYKAGRREEKVYNYDNDHRKHVIT